MFSRGIFGPTTPHAFFQGAREVMVGFLEYKQNLFKREPYDEVMIIRNRPSSVSSLNSTTTYDSWGKNIKDDFLIPSIRDSETNELFQ